MLYMEVMIELWNCCNMNNVKVWTNGLAYSWIQRYIKQVNRLFVSQWMKVWHIQRNKLAVTWAGLNAPAIKYALYVYHPKNIKIPFFVNCSAGSSCKYTTLMGGVPEKYMNEYIIWYVMTTLLHNLHNLDVIRSWPCIATHALGLRKYPIHKNQVKELLVFQLSG